MSQLSRTLPSTNGNGQSTKYTIARNFSLKDGHLISLQEQFGKDYKEKLTKEIIGCMAEREDLDMGTLRVYNQKAIS